MLRTGIRIGIPPPSAGSKWKASASGRKSWVTPLWTSPSRMCTTTLFSMRVPLLRPRDGPRASPILHASRASSAPSPPLRGRRGGPGRTREVQLFQGRARWIERNAGCRQGGLLEDDPTAALGGGAQVLDLPREALPLGGSKRQGGVRRVDPDRSAPDDREPVPFDAQHVQLDARR